MLLRSLGLLAAALVAASPLAVLAQNLPAGTTLAAPGSVEETAGQGILYYVGGRTKDDAMRTSNDFNPYQIDGDSLLFSLGAFFVNTDDEGGSVNEGELSIKPQFNTPLEAYDASAATPGIIPFALLQNGVCHAGYVTGYPVPDTIYAVDLAGEACHAATVEQIVYAAYAAAAPDVPATDEPATDVPATEEPSEDTVEPTEDVPPVVGTFDPARPSDMDLDVIVWAAYNAAYAVAVSSNDYLFIRNGDYATLRDAIASELAKEGYAGVTVADAPSASPADALVCAAPGTTELKVAFISADAGIVLVAASERRKSSYLYDPNVSTDLDIRYARDCQTSGFGRSQIGNVP